MISSIPLNPHPASLCLANSLIQQPHCLMELSVIDETCRLHLPPSLFSVVSQFLFPPTPIYSCLPPFLTFCLPSSWLS